MPPFDAGISAKAAAVLLALLVPLAVLLAPLTRRSR